MSEPVPHHTAETLLNRAHQAIQGYRNSAAIEAASQVIALAGDNPDGQEVLARAHSICAVANFDLGNIRKSEEHIDAAMAVFDELDDERHIAWCEVRLAWCSHERGDLPRAMHLASRVLAAARQHGWDDLEGKALLSIGNVAWKRGDRSAALGDLERAAVIFERLGMVGALQRTRGVIGYVKVLDGEIGPGRELLEGAIDYFRRVGDTLHVVKMVSNLAFVHFAQGELPEARELLLRAAELCSEDCPQPQLYIAYNLGLIELHLGRMKDAKKNLLRSRQAAVELNDPVTEAMSSLYLGVLKIRENLPGEAVELFQLSHKNLVGSACDEAGLTSYYLALGYLATARVDKARAIWAGRTPVSELLDCLDDFKILAETLDYICSHAYQPPKQVSVGTLNQAAAWRDELLREINTGKPS